MRAHAFCTADGRLEICGALARLWTGCEAAVSMQRARSVTGPLRRAHPASGATWNVQVVRGKMSSQCLWHACRALSAGLLLMLLGAAMAVIGYYADTLSVDQEVRGNSTVSVKDEARGFHLNNLSYAGPIVMGFGGFIVVAACVMTFEARDSAAKVTPARPQALPRPLPRRGPACAAPARLDQLGVYRLPHVLPLPHALPLPPLHIYRHCPTHLKARAHGAGSGTARVGSARFGSAPDLRGGSARAALTATALRRPLRRYALSVDEPHHSVAVSASAAESECGSQTSLAMDLHGSGACAGVTLRVRDNTRRRPLARQQRLRDDTVHPTPVGSTSNINNTEFESAKTHEMELNEESPTDQMANLSVEIETRAHSAPPAPLISSPSLASPPLHASPPTSPRLLVTPAVTPAVTPSSDSCITLTAATSTASGLTIVPSPDVSINVTQSEVAGDVTPVVISDVTSDVLLVVAPDVTLVVTPDVVTPLETPAETLITIEQTQQNTPSEEDNLLEVSGPPPPDI